MIKKWIKIYLLFEKSNLLSIFLKRYEEKVENINIFERQNKK